MCYQHCVSAGIAAVNKRDKVTDLRQLIVYEGVTEGAQGKVNNKSRMSCLMR